MITFRAVYQTSSFPYVAYFDASNERKARRFFAQWEKKLHSDTFTCILKEVAFYRPSFSFSSRSNEPEAL